MRASYFGMPGHSLICKSRCGNAIEMPYCLKILLMAIFNSLRTMNFRLMFRMTQYTSNFRLLSPNAVKNAEHCFDGSSLITSGWSLTTLSNNFWTRSVSEPYATPTDVCTRPLTSWNIKFVICFEIISELGTMRSEYFNVRICVYRMRIRFTKPSTPLMDTRSPGLTGLSNNKIMPDKNYLQCFVNQNQYRRRARLQ